MRQLIDAIIILFIKYAPMLALYWTSTLYIFPGLFVHDSSSVSLFYISSINGQFFVVLKIIGKIWKKTIYFLVIFELIL